LEENVKNRNIIAIAAIAAALAGCSGQEPNAGKIEQGERTPGTIDFNLTLPNGEEAETIDLHLECPGISQDHELDVEAGVAKAAFGGLEGMCTVTLSTVTGEGTDCSGSQSFTVVPDAVTPIAVTLICQGDNEDNGGGIVVNPEFEVRACTTDRIRKVYAVPSTLRLGQSTDVQVELHSGSLVGAATYTFGVVNDATHPGEASLAATSGACDAAAASCRQVTCDGLGGSSAVDPITGLPVAGVFVSVTVEDTDCRDTETVLVECLQDSVCGNSEVTGVEGCDDGNTTNGDGCSSVCEDEICGDGVINNNGTEACDGLAGVTPGVNVCDVVTCQLVILPTCGDDVINQPTEQCDGTDTAAGRTCSATCTFVPVCGNGFVEAPEVCDDGNVVSEGDCSADCSEGPADPICGDNAINQPSEQCDGTAIPAGQPTGTTCSATCQLVAPMEVNLCLECVTTPPISTALTDDLCGTSSDPLCYAVLACYIGGGAGDQGCFANGASPAECYCGAGADTDACVTAAFVPSGPCVAAMRAAKVGGTNADIVDGVFGFDTLGWAGQIMLEAQGLCPAACGFN
jgi:cysteine-rich repeat protein